MEGKNKSITLFIHSCLINRFETRLSRRVPLVEKELLTLPEHLRSPPVFSGVRVKRYLVLCVCFVDRCLSFCSFSFDHCIVCSSSVYGFCWQLLYNVIIIITKVLSISGIGAYTINGSTLMLVGYLSPRVVRDKALTWLIGCIYYWHLQFLVNVTIIKAGSLFILLPRA